MTTVVLPKRPESSLGAAFVRAFKKRYKTWKIFKLSTPGQRGWPDYMALSPHGETLFLEFKRPGEKPTKIQQECLDWLVANGFQATWENSVGDAIQWVEDSCYEV